MSDLLQRETKQDTQASLEQATAGQTSCHPSAVIATLPFDILLSILTVQKHTISLMHAIHKHLTITCKVNALITALHTLGLTSPPAPKVHLLKGYYGVLLCFTSTNLLTEREKSESCN